MKTMKSAFLSLGAAICLTAASLAQAQEAADLPSAESILDRYIEVTGGFDSYNSLTSAMTQGTMEISGAGITGELEIYIKPGAYFMHVELPGVGTIESGVTDGVAWEDNVITGPRILAGAEAELAIVGAHPAAAAKWRDIYETVETVGTEDVEGESSYLLEMTTSQGFTLAAAYGIDSGLLRRQSYTMTTQGITLPVSQYFRDYTDGGDIISASTVMIDQGVAQVFLRFKSGEYNIDIPNEKFAMPESVAALVQ
jgi:hypothetical protein